MTFLQNLNPIQRQLSCPNCSQRLRVPLKMGKTLRISCPKCQTQFDIQFKHPLQGFFRWDRKQSFQQNLNGYTQRFKALPRSTQYVIIAGLVLFILLFTGAFSSPEEPGTRPTHDQRQSFI